VGDTEPSASPGGEDGPPLRVLVVDDNKDGADSTVLLLDTVGFQARACYDGWTALRLVSSYRPGLCFLDLNMPGMDGAELAVKLRQWAGRRRLVLVALTAMSGRDYGDRIKAAGFDLHLVKPVDPFNLEKVVDTLFRAWRGEVARVAGDGT
jgi:CheY-like chemotaxis protein